MIKEKKMILIVDDNPVNHKVIGSILIDNGYEVGSSLDGNNALEFIKRIEPDLILLDIMMPEMDGFEVCKRLKNNVLTRHIPVIFLTSKNSTEDIVKGFQKGGVDYISKPFNKDELLARINTHIEIKILRGFLPICMHCKSIRDDKGYWNSIEEYMDKHADVIFSHSLCPKCMKKIYNLDPQKK